MSMLEILLADILEKTGEGVHAVDAEGMTVIYNQRAALHDGLEQQNVIGRHILDMFPSLNSQNSTLLSVLATREAKLNILQCYVNSAGRKIETVNSTYPIFHHGTLLGAVEIAKDYTAVKALSETLVDLQQKFSQSALQKQRGKIEKTTFDSIITQNALMKKTVEQARKAAKHSSTVLISGETGTGKELFVQALHEASPRSDKPFIAQNCAALPENLLESILFGTAKGSFTGAVDRPGLLQIADGGTLFLDELQSMPLHLQAKLLRVLEEKEVRRIGSCDSKSVDVRIIAAMNKEPFSAAEEGVLRHDLFYRLSVFTISLPPLKQRQEDILMLADHFIRAYNREFFKNVTGIHPAAENILLSYSWPGNIRELKHTIEYSMNIMEGSTLLPQHLPQRISGASLEESTIHIGKSSGLKEKLKNYERSCIEEALFLTGGNVSKAAALLQIPRQTLQYKLKYMPEIRHP
ncbi:AAA domain-containing protein [Bacillus lacus]|uniref:AAA domain-containing protein n=1 Tax=Metabacillus lacus TaxID=1983721 RepID=A0A7X2IZY0_9BACI|nr:sigma 54-interacting transcriptional regulator [Metabacillus lacus]MRX72886.1 AAA domain-containing protein [Metabacillus lacus]